MFSDSRRSCMPKRNAPPKNIYHVRTNSRVISFFSLFSKIGKSIHFFGSTYSVIILSQTPEKNNLLASLRTLLLFLLILPKVE